MHPATTTPPPAVAHPRRPGPGDSPDPATEPGVAAGCPTEHHNASAAEGRSPRRRRPSLGALLGAVLAALLCALSVGATPAAAHAALVSTDPADGSVVATAPQEVTLTFSEGVLLATDSLRVLDPRGNRVDAGAPRHVAGDSATARVPLHAGLPDGTFTVAWKAVSEDSHPVSGAFTFSIGAPSTTTVDASATVRPDATVDTLYGIGRYAAYAGFAALVGGCVFAGVCRSARPVERIAAGGWVTLFAATLLLLLLRAPYTSGDGLGAVTDLGAVGDALSTRPGAALLSRLLLLGAAAVFLAVLFGTYARQRDERQRRDLAFGLGVGGAVVAAGIAATWSMAEHASVGIQSGLAMPVDVAHLLAVAVWLGGLVSLLATLHAGEPVPRAAVHRFSRLAFGSVLTLTATGLYQTWRQVGSWGALTDTSYGRWLLVKVGLVAVLVGIASVSRRWTGRLTDAAYGAYASTDSAAGATADATPDTATTTATTTAAAADSVRTAQLARQRAAMARTAARRKRDGDVERAGLRRSVAAETVVAVALLAVATVLSGTQPGRAETEQRQAAAAADAKSPAAGGPIDLTLPYDTGGANGRGTVAITIEPARTGDNQLHIQVEDQAGRPVDVAELKVSFTLAARDLGPLSVPLAHLTVGHWTASRAQLPAPGEWTVAVSVRTSDVDEVTERKTFTIGS